MNLTLLECFATLARELHFSRAARTMGMSQSAFSDRIQRLEAEVGVALAVRDSRNVALTEAGTIFLGHAQAMLDEYETALRVTRLAGQGKTGELRVGSVPSALNTFIPSLVRQLSRSAPGLIVHIDEDGSTQQVARLARGTLDLAVVRGRESTDTSVVLELLYSEPLAAFVARQHPLARQSTKVTRKTLSRYPLIMWARSGGFVLYDEILEIARGAGSRAQIIEAPNTTSERAFAAAGLGVLVRPWSWPSYDDNIIRVPIADASSSELYLGYRTPLESPPLRLVVDLARREGRKLRKVTSTWST